MCTLASVINNKTKNMKKILLSVLSLFAFMLCNAQVKTQSNYDVDGKGKITIEDVTSTVNKVLGKALEERTLVDGGKFEYFASEIRTEAGCFAERAQFDNGEVRNINHNHSRYSGVN